MEEALFKVLSFITFIMLGYLLRRLSILKAETFRVLSGIVFYITLPCIIITSINGVPVTSETVSYTHLKPCARPPTCWK